MRKLPFILILLVPVFFYACSTDVEITAPHKEMAVVYGLLNQNDSINYVKINRVFSGKGNAYDMAKISDSSNYNPADLEVKLERIKGNESLGFISLNDTIINGAVTGTFAKDKNIFYYTNEKLYGDSRYKLTVKNKSTGYMADASTGLINNLNFKQGLVNISFVGTDRKFTSTTVEWLSQPNGKTYQLTLRFHYIEYVNGNDSTYKYIDWVFSQQNSTNSFGGQQMEQTIKGEDFYKYLQANSDKFTGNFKRKAGKVELILACVGEDFQVYNDLVASYSSTYQEKPVYTNVNNGVGIFNCRTKAPSQIRTMSAFSVDELKNGSYTIGLGFE